MQHTKEASIKAKTQVLFSAAAGADVGLGHLRRSLAVAESARRRGFQDICFVSDPSGAVERIVAERGFAVADQGSLSPQHHGVAVIDRKDDVTSHVKDMKRRGIRVCLLDNATDARLHADLAVYPIAHFNDRLDWAGFGGKMLVGPEFFPLSPEFPPFRDSEFLQGESILITMGGSDFNNLTLKILDAIRGIKDISIDAVVGPVCRHKKQLAALQDTFDGNVKLHFDAGNMPELMSRAAVAISAFGITLYELAFMGVPAIIINNYVEDRESAELFARHGCAVSLGYHESLAEEEIAAAVEKLLTDKSTAADMSGKGRRLVDGNGGDRIVEAIESLIP